jgi:hypothetical protein
MIRWSVVYATQRDHDKSSEALPVNIWKTEISGDASVHVIAGSRVIYRKLTGNIQPAVQAGDPADQAMTDGGLTPVCSPIP